MSRVKDANCSLRLEQRIKTMGIARRRRFNKVARDEWAKIIDRSPFAYIAGFTTLVQI